MADILNDEPAAYAADPQIQDQNPAVSVDGESGNEFRESLRSLNRLARGHVALTGYNVRTVLEFNAVGDGVTDDYQAFQDALASFGAPGGMLLIPPRIYRIIILSTDRPRVKTFLLDPSEYSTSCIHLRLSTPAGRLTFDSAQTGTRETSGGWRFHPNRLQTSAR